MTQDLYYVQQGLLEQYVNELSLTECVALEEVVLEGDLWVVL